MSTLKYPNEIKINPNQGGKAAIERLVEAYGFTTRQALADHLKVSKSTLANRYMRDTFPADWIIQCALETGASLAWLTTGNGPIFDDARNDLTTVPLQKVIEGKLYDDSFLLLDARFLNRSLIRPLALNVDGEIYIAESEFDEITDGKWLVKIEGKISIKNLTRVPIGMVKVMGSNSNFECSLTDITAIAKCKGVFTEDI
ncbi:TPA: phage repressor protein CI [Citrobacter freundii]|uniref:phage repressor protein CI n=1 Tax=Citrobacter freundii TaxID=546 RepID=UPI000C80DDD2|nr:phage repressor protein CI [Citrobacter freundii]PMD01612.1 phage repressor protein [Citrobacter freundii]WLV33051.1 phage repressor protein CI [Citrobacter freundii]HCC8366087.1 phage repressor protein CI [Citrobacter freundii]HCJ6661601.1 phage repressor protein CI [Citrobacter freundii]HCJ7430183.1 phage repressor protein CI [Citrobacter freundii]